MALDARNLNLGCGRLIYPNSVNLDRVMLPGVDVVADLDETPWPFPDGRFNEVWACNIFEHVEDPIGFMAECWRLLEPTGLLQLVGPHWQHENAYTDPTHRRALTEHTFDYWIPGTVLHSQFGEQYAGASVFEKQSIELSDAGDVIALLRKP